MIYLEISICALASIAIILCFNLLYYVHYIQNLFFYVLLEFAYS
jgi:hypothetical protein